ncbi:MAG: insulinase family protein, partial [Verrucomicrobiae bacterium]|nr:insulinase family protein [Verrucomicrobiae bacterium]
ALDVLSDLYLHARLDPADVARERAVIKEELAMYRDQPQHQVHELLNQMLWPRHPLGYPVAGTPESLDRIRRVDLIEFKRRHYVASNTVVAVAGACEHDDVVQRVRKWLRVPRHSAAPAFEPVRRPVRGPRLRMSRRRVEQAALALGVRAYSRNDPRRYALKILSVMLGENMSSRLFQVIREERGLAYSIQTSTAFLADTGALVVSAGLDPGKLQKAMRLILRELQRIARHRPPGDELQRAKDYALGQMWLGLESTTNQMMWIGEHVLAYGYIEEPHVIEKRIQMLTPEEIKDVAADVFRNDNLAAAVVTPSDHEDELRAALRW